MVLVIPDRQKTSFFMTAFQVLVTKDTYHHDSVVMCFLQRLTIPALVFPCFFIFLVAQRPVVSTTSKRYGPCRGKPTLTIPVLVFL